MTTRAVALLSILAALLVGAVVASYAYMDAERCRAARAADDLVACRRLAERIGRLQTAPDLASEGERVADEVTGLVESAAKAAGLPVGGLVRIMPGPAQRVGDTVYKEKPTQVIIEKAPMKPIVGLMHGLVTGRPPLEVRSLRLSATHPEQSTDAWDGELTVTYLIYDPPQAGP